ncbi:MAG: SocA family protein [Bacteroidales bacterium]|nr:SocA family protein [Bacteroidales bacterium]
MTAINTPVFDREKAINVVLYVANKLERRDFHKIFKVIYFADKAHLSEWGRTISGDSYVAMNDGPVPTRIYDMFKIVRGDSLYSSDKKAFSFYSKFFDVNGNYFLVPKKDADMKYLSPSDIEFLDKSLNENKDLPFAVVREKSHDFAWRNTAKDALIDFSDMMREDGNDEGFISFINEKMLVENFYASRH